MAERSTKPLIVAPLIVTIDGPAGAGKSTVARALAQRFGLLNLESGAMYRAVALKALQTGVSTTDVAALEALAHATDVRLESTSEAGDIGNRVPGNRVLLDGVDVTEQLRTPQITAAASEVSVHPPIRRWLVGLQQALGAQGNVVMEGRDIGTVVFPQAPVKIFLDASPEKRGERRYEQTRTEQPGRSADGRRSRRNAASRHCARSDSRARPPRPHPQRLTPPPAPDAIIIDSTDLTLDQVIERAAGLVERYLAGE